MTSGEAPPTGPHSAGLYAREPDRLLAIAGDVPRAPPGDGAYGEAFLWEKGLLREVVELGAEGPVLLKVNPRP